MSVQYGEGERELLRALVQTYVGCGLVQTRIESNTSCGLGGL